MLLTSRLSNSWNWNCNTRISSRRTCIQLTRCLFVLESHLIAASSRDFILKLHFSFSDQLLLLTKPNGKTPIFSDYYNDSKDGSDIVITLPDSEACLICWQIVCCIYERHFHSLLLPEIVLTIGNPFFLQLHQLTFQTVDKKIEQLYYCVQHR